MTSSGYRHIPFPPFVDLIQILNTNHNTELIDSDRFLFYTLYSQVFLEMNRKNDLTDLVGFSNQVEDVLSLKLEKLDKKYQDRFETIMANKEVKHQLIDFLSKQVYLHHNESI